MSTFNQAAENAWMDEFAKMDRSRFRLPLMSVDVALFSLIGETLCVLLVKRDRQPQMGLWALAGVMFDPAKDKTLEDAARRALTVKTHETPPYLEQLKTFSGPRSKDGEARDPRIAISTAYLGLAPSDRIVLPAQHGETEVGTRWAPVDQLEELELAFDHNDIVREALARLRGKVSYSMLPARALGDAFSLPHLQKAYELILGEKLDKSAFRKKILESGFLEEAPGRLAQASGAGRPSSLWRIKQAEGAPIATFRRTFLA